MGLLKRVFRLLCETIVILTAITFIPGIPPTGKYDFEEIEQSLPYTGALAPNNKLDNAVRLFEGVFNAPESVASRGKDNEIFVSMHGGSIVQVLGPKFDKIKQVTKIGPGCNAPWEEHICGRPLGLRFANDGKLLVADSYLGIFRVDVDTGEKELLVDPSEPINGAVPLLIDDLDEDSEGNIYWSDASSIAPLSAGSLEGLAGGSGRLVKRDVSSGRNMVLIDGLTFANGVQLSPQQDFVLVCETWNSRILRYWLRGPAAGTHDVFVSGLPGFPDNIRSKPGGGYYVSLVIVKDPAAVDITRVLGRLPWLRRLMARVLYNTKKMFDVITSVYDNTYTPQIAYSILNTGNLGHALTGNRSMVASLDARGNIDGSLQGTTGRVLFISETTQVGDKLFFGSPYNKYLGMLDLATDAPPKVEAPAPGKPAPTEKEEL